MSCSGRDHIQSSGTYDLTFADPQIIKDTCDVLAKQPAVDGSSKALWSADLTVLGDTVRMRAGLYEVLLVGDYQRTIGEDGREHFIVDGSSDKVTANIAGSECLVDVVT